jgi:putative phosphoesterase
VDQLARAQLILHAGDFVSAGFLAELEAIGPPVEGVHGNMDEAAVKNSLPRRLVTAFDGLRIGMVHDPGPRLGREGRLAARFHDCDAVIFGHTHVPQVERFGDLWILNPGSPTERRSSPTHTMLVLTVKGRRLAPRLVTLGG